MIHILHAGKSTVHSIPKPPIQPKVRLCGRHKDPLQYFCDDCSKLLCCQCLASGNHKEHHWTELKQAFMSMETCLEQICRSTQEAVSTATRQREAIQVEKKRVSAKCNTAKNFIHSKLEVIRDHLNTRKAFLYLNLDHASSRHTYLKHRRPMETLNAELKVVDGMQKSGEGLLASLATEDLAALGEVHKARDRLKKVQKVVMNAKSNLTKTHILPPSTKFETNNLGFFQSLLSTFGRVDTGAFVQGVHEFSRCNSVNLPPYCRLTPSQQKEESNSNQKTMKKHCVTSPRLNKKQGSIMSNRELPPLPQEPISTHTSGGVRTRAHTHSSHSQKSHRRSAEIFLQTTNYRHAQGHIKPPPPPRPLSTPLLLSPFDPTFVESRNDSQTYASPSYLTPPPPPFPPPKSPESTEDEYMYASPEVPRLVVIPPPPLRNTPQTSTSAEGDNEVVYDVPNTSEEYDFVYEEF